MTHPERFAVCPRCDGRGTHVNPAIDGDGITSEEMHALGTDFLGDYLGGVYDIVCERCDGDRVVPRCSTVLAGGRCPAPVEPGEWWADDPGVGLPDPGAAPYRHCLGHLDRVEMECWQGDVDYRAEQDAERRAGA